MRVSIAESQRIISQNRDIRQFKGEPNNTYRLIFPFDENNEAFCYLNKVHEINLGRIRGRARCVKDYILEDEQGNLIKDPVTGRPLNDGSCPYCAVFDLSRKILNKEIEEFREANPDATEKQEKEHFSKLTRKMAAKGARFFRGFVVAKVACDSSGQKPVLVDGQPSFEIQFLPMSENQFDTKFTPAKKQYDDVEGLRAYELLFSYPDGDAMSAAKNLTIQPVLKPFIDTYPELLDAITEKLASLDLDKIEEQTFLFRPESVPAIERKVASVVSRLSSGLNEEELEEIRTKLSENLVTSEAATLADLQNDIEDAGNDIVGEGNEAISEEDTSFSEDEEFEDDSLLS